MRLAFVVAIGMSLVGTAQAADLPEGVPLSVPVKPLPAPAPYNWTGFYFGVNAGYGFATATDTASAGGLSASISEDLSGAVAGGYVGGNIQYGSFVVGLEGMGEWSNQTHTFIFIPSGATIVDHIDWLAIGRLRAGVAINRVLLYAAGGAGYGGGGEDVSVVGFSSSSAGNKALWTVGAGVEIAATNNIDMRAEYLFAQTFDSIEIIGAATLTNHISDNIVLVGLGYKFGAQ